MPLMQRPPSAHSSTSRQEAQGSLTFRAAPPPDQLDYELHGRDFWPERMGRERRSAKQ